MTYIKTVIYLDELLLVNFAASAALLLGAGLVCGRRCSGLRLVAGSAAGAAASLALLWPELPFWASLGYKAASCAAMTALCYGLQGARGFLHLCAWVLLLSLALTGAALLPGAEVHSNNLSLYVPLSPALLLACCGGIYGLLRVLRYCFGSAAPDCFAASLELGPALIPLRVFYDTGFTVQDAITGRAVVLVRFEAVREHLPAPLREYLSAYFAGEAAEPPPGLNIRLLPCGTAAGRCLLPAVPAQALVRGEVGKAKRCERVLAAFAAELPPEEWTALIGADAARALGV